jgi:all-trans-retinol 13,14-reductase
MAPEYDIVIVGSGLGGLICGAILSREGYRVCVLEKNRQLGGCLQTFARDKVVFDSGVHYIGGLAKGQNLYQIFAYLGLMEVLKLERMDESAFDQIVFLEDGQCYSFAQGYERFIDTLAGAFPRERTAIEKYCTAIKEVCNRFPLYNLRLGEGLSEKADVLQIDTYEFIASLTGNTRLQEVLAGNNLLYAGLPHKTPFYVHALVTNSYIESAWKCIHGGSQISLHLAKIIRANGGTVRNHARVTRFIEKEGSIQFVELADGSTVSGKSFISNLHPQQTLSMTDSNLLRPVYRKRIARLENSISSFCVHAVMKPGSFPYLRQNYYLHEKGGVWGAIEADQQQWPMSCGIYCEAASQDTSHASGLCLMAYMPFEWVAPWQDSFNTDSEPGERGESYERFKAEKGAALIALAEKQFPGLKDAIQSFTCSTPLTYRDYIGTSDGSMYGIQKNYRDPMSTFILPATRIPNLYLTGQNLNLHGILGVTISALTTCGAFTDLATLVQKIKSS